MKCFYHADLDGHCSGAIVKSKYPQCEMIEINYGDSFPWDSIEDSETVFMVDFCLQPFSDMIKLNGIVSLFWIDHHKTAIEEANKLKFVANGCQYLEISKAGCELTWEYIYGDSKYFPSGVEWLGRYDVWDHENENILPFQYGMRMIENTHPYNQELWESVFNDYEFCESIVKTGKTIIEYEKAQNKKFCKMYAFETLLNGITAICANRGLINSKLFDSVYDNDKHDLMITFSRMKLPANKWTVSLYSTKEEIDCGIIARFFGGGGHKGAAGFQCEELPFEY